MRLFAMKLASTKVLSSTLIFCVSIVVNGCMVESAPDERRYPLYGETNTTSPELDLAAKKGCRLTADTGCFEGSIAVAPDLYVKGRPYHDASVLGQEFVNLMQSNLKYQSDATYKISLLEPIDNRTFTDGFDIFLKADELALKTLVLPSGRFQFHEVSPGEYFVRAQRTIKLKVEKTPIENPENTTSTAKKPKFEVQIYCAYLYADQALEITRSERTKKVFDRFDIFIPRAACGEEKDLPWQL